jgi:NTE family protein
MKTFGLALGSGSFKGFYHIGVLKCLEDNNIKIDYLSGTSAGALIGGIYLSTNSAKETEKICLNMTKKDYALIFSNFNTLPHKGILQGEKLINKIAELTQNKKIENLPIPFIVLATDLLSGSSVKITKGELSHAIRASSSVPFLFKPYKINDTYLIDGGLSAPVPFKAVKDLGANVVLSVSLHNPKNTETINLKTIIYNTIQISLYNLTKEQIKNSDISLYPQIKDTN